MNRSTRVLELGTFTGYGTLCLAEGVSLAQQGTGSVLTIDKDPLAQNIARRYCTEAGDVGKMVKRFLLSLVYFLFVPRELTGRRLRWSFGKATLGKS